MRRLLAILLLVIPCSLFIVPCTAQTYTYNYTPGCARAYTAYMSLDLQEGTALVKQEIRANPYNLMATYLANYEDCLLLVLNGNRKDYEQRKGHLDERLDLLSKGPSNNPWHRFCRAQMYMHWAMAYIRMGDNMKGALAFRKAYNLAKENAKLYPQFKQNNIILGIAETAAGTVPDDYKWIASIFGMKGSVTKGLARFNTFLQGTPATEPMRAEAVILHAYLKFYLQSKQEEVWKFVNSTAFPVEGNLMHAFVRVNLGLNSRHAAVSLQTLRAAQKEKTYASFPMLDFEMATALQQQLSPDAVGYFQRFLSHTGSKAYVKEAWQKMSWSYYMAGNMPKAQQALAKVKTEGSTSTDADKTALRFANAGVFPHAIILQSRLLFDGGYYNEALSKLQPTDAADYTAMPDRLEYYFRLGRIYDELNKDTKAAQFYRTTINQGRERQEQFAARASLYLGLMHEKRGQKTEALAAFKDCLSMRHHDFQAGIDQQAKAGINRLTM